MRNPFITNGYAGPKYFCDREKEAQMLTDLITNGHNVALISPRRVGKTDLLHHCFEQKQIKGDFHTFIIDIYATNSISDFVSVFGKTIEIIAEKPCKRHVQQCVKQQYGNQSDLI